MSRTHAAIDVPTATRAQPPGWRDPRLWIGVAIVAVSIIAGARILGGADDSVTVWAAARDVAPGDTVGEDDPVSTSVRFGDSADLDRYLRTSVPLPDDLRLIRGLGAGELVPAAALGSGEAAETVIVSLAFPHELIPTNIGAGSVIELLVIPDDSAGGDKDVTSEPTTVLSDVVVIDAPSGADSLGSVSRGRQLVLGIPEADSDALTEIPAASEDQRVRVLVRG
ncbi:hypothetical protein [Nocardioides sp. B-3]|uniref:hypothetical protein n=1 Tax=Nocardioides sp. B-3 TaxID=2895565 RepID=UPI0021525C20|nr:hypothetical protein [Nocardioides sp. B-3]UUZ60156.1 hypothetical protein LP418_04185 [Nocardioides sp. B-3]